MVGRGRTLREGAHEVSCHVWYAVFRHWKSFSHLDCSDEEVTVSKGSIKCPLRRGRAGENDKEEPIPAIVGAERRIVDIKARLSATGL